MSELTGNPYTYHSGRKYNERSKHTCEYQTVLPFPSKNGTGISYTYLMYQGSWGVDDVVEARFVRDGFIQPVPSLRFSVVNTPEAFTFSPFVTLRREREKYARLTSSENPRTCECRSGIWIHVFLEKAASTPNMYTFILVCRSGIYILAVP